MVTFIFQKDDKALISAIMFANYAGKLTFKPDNGREVVLFGSVDVYPARGTYQFLLIKWKKLGLARLYRT